MRRLAFYRGLNTHLTSPPTIDPNTVSRRCKDCGAPFEFRRKGTHHSRNYVRDEVCRAYESDYIDCTEWTRRQLRRAGIPRWRA